MAELHGRTGAWTFDGEVIRIVPGRDRGVHKLRQAIGEVVVPLAAVAGVVHEQGKKDGRLRLRLRDGADPLTQASRGLLSDAADPYQLPVGDDASGIADYFVDEVRNALLLEQVPDGPSDRYLMPGPAVPLAASAGDGTATFDGDRIKLEWSWIAEETKRQAGPRQFTLSEVSDVEWAPVLGLENGYLRFHLSAASSGLPPKKDPYCLTWGIRREGGTTVLLAAAVLARLPHPSAPSAPPALLPQGTGNDLLRDLRELGELHREGILTDDEFAAAKQLLLRRHQER